MSAHLGGSHCMGLNHDHRGPTFFSVEYYESTCGSCGNKWSWVGFKTGIGKTAEQLEAMGRAGKECPRCKSSASVGLDHTSEDARALDGFLSGVARAIVGR